MFAEDDDELLRASLHDGIRWVRSAFVGTDHLIRSGILDGACVWTGTAGVYARPIAEHVLALLLMAARNLHAYARAELAEARTSDALRVDRGLVGVGGSAARSSHLEALGARTIATTRSGRKEARELTRERNGDACACARTCCMKL